MASQMTSYGRSIQSSGANLLSSCVECEVVDPVGGHITGDVGAVECGRKVSVPALGGCSTFSG